MMWLPRVFILLVAFAGVRAGVEEDINNCHKDLENDLKDSKNDIMCLILPKVFDCFSKAIEDGFGFSLEILAGAMAENEIGKIAIQVLGVQRLLEVYCSEGSQLPQLLQDRVGKDVPECKNSTDFAILEKTMSDSPDSDELDITCPAVFNAMNCIEDAFKKYTNFTLEEVQQLLEGNHEGVNKLIEFRSTFQDLCDEASQLNRDRLEKDIDECTNSTDFDILKEELAFTCPAVFDSLNCLEDAFKKYKKYTNLTVEEVQQFLQGDEEVGYINTLIHFRSTFQDLCDEGSQLNRDFRANAECYKSINSSGEIEACKNRILTVLETIQEFKEVPEVTGDDGHDDSRECTVEAYETVCEGVEIHEKCGRDAFDTYMQINRRITAFKYGACTEEQLQDAKAKFFDSVVPRFCSSQRELYNRVFDLKKEEEIGQLK